MTPPKLTPERSAAGVVVLVELRKLNGTAITLDLIGRLGWTRGRTTRALRDAEAEGLVTSERVGGRTHGRPTWWTLTDTAHELLRGLDR